jgi:para-nitrobenzyl esterase
MASPLSRGLFARAIGESGGAFSPTRLWQRSEAEEAATQFAQHVSATSLRALRAMSAEELLAATGPADNPAFPFWPSIDGHFLSDTPESRFSAGAQASVPLLVGTNSLEGDPAMVLRGQPPTPEVWRETLGTLFRTHADEALSHYPGNDESEVLRSAAALAGNLFVTHSTWRWMNQHRQTGHAPVYFYEYTHSRPPEVDASARSAQPATGARHGEEIDYALDNLDNEPRYAWTAEDRKVSRIFSGYVEQFVKTGNPNSEALPEWPPAREGRDGLSRQVVGSETRTVEDRSAAQQAFMQRFFKERVPDDGS